MDSQTQAKDLKEKGNEAFNNGRYEAAVEIFTKALELEPENEVFYSNRSAAYTKLNNFTKALEDAEYTIKLKPNWARGYSRKGTALYWLKQFSLAVAAFQAGLELERSQQLEQGLQLAQRALKAENIPNGTWSYLPIPFNSQNSQIIRYDLVDELCDWLVNKDCSGVVVPSPAEIDDLAELERYEIVERVVKRLKGKVSVASYSNFGDTLEKQVASVKKIWSLGVDVALISTKQLQLSTIDQSGFRDNLTKFLELIPEEITLGLVESQETLSIIDASVTLWITSLNRFLYYVDNSRSLQLLKTKFDAIGFNPGVKYFIGNTVMLLEGLAWGAAGYCGNGSCFFPNLYSWLCKHFAKEAEKALLVHRFLSISQPVVDRYFPLNVFVYLRLHIGFENLEEGSRSQKSSEFLEEDRLRLHHLKTCADFAWDNLKEGTSKKKDKSTLL